MVDVRGQTCPGYLLSINLAVKKLPQGSRCKLLISYPPCGEDVKAWCSAGGHLFEGMDVQEGLYQIIIITAQKRPAQKSAKQAAGA